MNGLESLKDELSMITKAKNEVEKRFQTTVIEKDTIFASLEEALDRIHTLERHVREQDNKLKVSFHTRNKMTITFNVHQQFLEHVAAFGSCATGKLFTEREISEYTSEPLTDARTN